MDEPNWPGVSLRRTTVDILKSYYGTLSDPYLMVEFNTLPNEDLEIGQEYIVFVLEAFVGEGEYPGDSSRVHYNQKQLDEIGGRGGIFLGRQLWIVDGDTAWRIPVEHIVEGPPGSDLAAAKDAGESLPVTELEAAIVAALR